MSVFDANQSMEEAATKYNVDPISSPKSNWHVFWHAYITNFVSTQLTDSRDQELKKQIVDSFEAVLNTQDADNRVIRWITCDGIQPQK